MSATAFHMRDATPADVPALAALRSNAAHHRGRLRDARRGGFRYFVLLRAERIIGFVCLVFRRPVSWANVDDRAHLPEVNDFYVAEAERSQGCGTFAVRALEQLVLAAGYTELYIAVEPEANPRAYALYRRLGYVALQDEPFYHRWAAVDGDGITRSGEAWLVNTVKRLG